MVSMNSLFLSIATKDVRFSSDVSSALQRCQILVTIYLYIAVFFKIFFFEISLWALLPSPEFPLLVTGLAAVMSFFGLLASRSGKYDISVAILLIYLNIANFSVGSYLKQPTAALYCVFPLLQIGFFVTSSTRIKALNVFACLLQALHHTMKILGVFETTLSDEQFQQITIMIAASTTSIALATVSCFAQRFIEENLLRVAHINSKNAENLTHEVFQSIEARERFAFSLTHEIIHPLNSMENCITSLMNSMKNLSDLKLLKKIRMNTEILLNLTNNVLDAGKLKTGKLEICYRKSSFEEVIQRALEIHTENFKLSNIIVKAFIDERVPHKLRIDPSRLFQIIMNIISNALKFTPKGGQFKIYATWHHKSSTIQNLLNPTSNFRRGTRSRTTLDQSQLTFREVGSQNQNTSQSSEQEASIFDEFSLDEEKIRFDQFKHLGGFIPHALEQIKKKTRITESGNWTVRRKPLLQSNDKLTLISSPSVEQLSMLENEDGFLKLELIDNGCEISHEDIQKLFATLPQLYQSTVPTTRGTDLGLWICKQLCQAMGGDINIYSQVDHRTIFVFYIPVDNNQFAERLISPLNVRSIVKALVVDDYPFNRDLHKLLLEKEGVHVTLACDGKEAFEKYKAKGDDYFDFILTDVQMPEMDGFTSAKKIREWEKENNKEQVDIYFVSGQYFNEEDVMAEFVTHENCRATGIWCLRKPLDIERLRRIIKKYKRDSQRRILSSDF